MAPAIACAVSSWESRRMPRAWAVMSAPNAVSDAARTSSRMRSISASASVKPSSVRPIMQWALMVARRRAVKVSLCSTPSAGAASMVSICWVAVRGAEAAVRLHAAAARPARLPKTSPFALERPPMRSAPCMPPVTSPAANSPGAPVAPSASMRMPPLAAWAYMAMRSSSSAPMPYASASHALNVRTNSGTSV